jgi:hypothetical protein
VNNFDLSEVAVLRFNTNIFAAANSGPPDQILGSVSFHFNDSNGQVQVVGRSPMSSGSTNVQAGPIGQVWSEALQRWQAEAGVPNYGQGDAN